MSHPATGEPPSDIEAVRADIEQARAELSQTVDALTSKLDVKAQAGDKIAEARTKATEAVTRAKEAAPPPVQHALDVAAEKASPVVAKAAPYRTQIIAGVALAVVLLRVLRRRRGTA
jgi:ElaB/YqjD/DUF883 family membrane-anchored ribosome-binding protein